MSDIGQTQQKLERLAKDLEHESNSNAAMRLRELSVAIGSHPSIENWAATDIYKVINADAIADGVRTRTVPGQLLRVAEWFRNVLVLLPLILTWFGISQAAEKYQALITLDKNNEQVPFLFLWQGGFNNTLWTPLILSNLALADAILLTIILSLTAIITWRYSLINARREKRAEQLRENIAYTLGDAQLCLVTAHRAYVANQQPKDINGVVQLLTTMVRDFKNVTETFVREMQDERKQRGSLNDYVQAMGKMTSDMLRAADETKKTNAELVKTIKGLEGPIQEIPALVVSAAQAVLMLRTMTDSLGRFVSDQALWRQELQTVLATKLEEMYQEQKKMGQELYTLADNGFTRVVTGQKQSAQEQYDLVKKLLEQSFNDQQAFEHTLYNTINGLLQKLLKEQQRLGNGLIDAADTLEDTGKSLTTVVKEIGTFTTQQEKVVETMNTQLGLQNNLTGRTTETTVAIGRVLNSVRDAVPELRSIAVNMDKYASAAAKLDMGANTLENAATVLQRVADKLNSSSELQLSQPISKQ